MASAMYIDKRGDKRGAAWHQREGSQRLREGGEKKKRGRKPQWIDKSGDAVGSNVCSWKR